jgi:hypothetical protein
MTLTEGPPPPAKGARSPLPPGPASWPREWSPGPLELCRTPRQSRARTAATPLSGSAGPGFATRHRRHGARQRTPHPPTRARETLPPVFRGKPRPGQAPAGHSKPSSYPPHDYPDSLARPLARLRARIARPARVRMRRRNPWVFLRLRVFGWKVRLDIVAPLEESEGPTARPTAVSIRDPILAAQSTCAQKDSQKRLPSRACGKARCYSAARFPVAAPTHFPRGAVPLPQGFSTYVERGCG